MRTCRSFFNFDFSELEELKKRVEGIEDAVNEAERQAVSEGIRIIRDAQRAHAPNGYGSAIKSRIIQQKDGFYYAESGYLEDAFQGKEKIRTVGYKGTVREFGVPGQSPGRKGMSYKVYKNGKKIIRVKKPLPAQPHIRRGFDEKIQEVSELVEKKAHDAVKKIMEG